MTPVNNEAALIAFNRFGLGARPGDFAKAGDDPRGFLKSELRQPDIALVSYDDPANSNLLTSTACIEAAMAANFQRKLDRNRLAAAIAAQADTMAPATSPAAEPMQQNAPPKPDQSVESQLFCAEAQARLRKATAAEAGFVERFVYFWSNHFCVSIAKNNIVRAAAGAFEREAIRPFVFSRFADMLVAVERHPVMLLYLDNPQSVGPHSRAGRNRGRGLNENLAREILELHTLGVGSGYTQADVTGFARILTGWTLAGREGRLGEPGSFVFNANAHEPGDETFLGKVYPAGGMGQAEAVLNDLARHPATARHIATKLARHFIADDPPPSAVAKLASVFQDRDGDLRALALTLIGMPETWSVPMTKMRAPFEYVAAIRRATGADPDQDPRQSIDWLHLLGAPLWQPPGPNGFSDLVSDEASPEGLKARLDIARQAARRLDDLGDPNDLAAAILGPTASKETQQAIAHAESKQQALALLFMAPEFQRR